MVSGWERERIQVELRLKAELNFLEIFHIFSTLSTFQHFIFIQFLIHLWNFQFQKKESITFFKSSHRRCSVRRSVLRNFSLQQSATLLKKRLWHRCFPVNFAKFPRTSFLQNTSGGLLLWVLRSETHVHVAGLGWTTFYYTMKITKNILKSWPASNLNFTMI